MKENKFKKVVVLDTVIFYPEHEEILKSIVEKPKIERVPLKYGRNKKKWLLTGNYELPEKANIIIWPSTLPKSFDDLDIETLQKLNAARCWTEAGLQKDIYAQNLYNRVKDADCILTCWTNIPDNVLDKLIDDGKTRAIITWTHEFKHRLNVEKARKAGIYTDCVLDYGTDSVAELEFDGLVGLIEKNKSTDKKAFTDEDIAIGTLSNLFNYFRKSDKNETATRDGRFSHEFHKIGAKQEHYAEFREKSLDEIIPERLLEEKKIGMLSNDTNLDYLENILSSGLRMNVKRASQIDDSSAEFYKFLATNEIIIYDSSKVSPSVNTKVKKIKKDQAIDVQELKQYEETLRGQTLGIIGLGRIGSRIAQIAETFGMNIQYYGLAEKEVGYKYVELDELMKTSDIISVNVEAHKADGLLSSEKIAMIRNGTYFINTSDGNAVDQKALTQRMLNNEIFAALDVYEGVPSTGTLCLDDNPKGKVKKQLANHVLTYRAGWITQESVRVKTYKLLGHMMDCLENRQAP